MALIFVEIPANLLQQCSFIAHIAVLKIMVNKQNSTARLMFFIAYRCGCSVGPGFTLLVHFSWQAILMFWMAAMAAVGREMEGGPIK